MSVEIIDGTKNIVEIVNEQEIIIISQTSVDSELALKVNKSGDTMTGTLSHNVSADHQIFQNGSSVEIGRITKQSGGDRIQILSGETTASANLWADIHGIDGSGGAGMRLTNYNDSASGGNSVNLSIRKSGGTKASPTAVGSAIRVGQLVYSPYDGAAFQATAAVEAWTESAASSGSAPTRLEFSAGVSTAGRLSFLQIMSNGRIQIGSATTGTAIASSDTSKVGIFGSSDVNQLLIQGNSTQTVPYQKFQKSDGTAFGGIAKQGEGDFLQILSGTTTVANGVLLEAYGEGTQGGARLRLTHYNNGVTANSSVNILLRKYRGTRASPLANNDNDRVGAISFAGYDGSSDQFPGDYTGWIDGTPTSGNVPIRLEMNTGTNASNKKCVLQIRSDARVQIGNVTQGNPVSTDSAKFLIEANNADIVSQSINLSASQVADAFTIKKSATVLAAFNKDGWLGIGADPIMQLHIKTSNSAAELAYFSNNTGKGIIIGVESGNIGYNSTASSDTEYKIGINGTASFRFAIKTGTNFVNLGDTITAIDGLVGVGNLNPATKAFVVRGADTQATSLQEWQAFGGSVLGSFSETGKMNAVAYAVGGADGVSGSFTTVDGKTVTVVNGIITAIV